MKPKKVGIRLYFLLLFCCVLLFLIAGGCGMIIGAFAHYSKTGVWVFNGGFVLGVLKGAIIYGGVGATFLWVKAKMGEQKKNLKIKD